MRKPLKRGEIAQGSAWALVTGAGSGIGRCIALRLAALGYRLVLVGSREEPLLRTQHEILTRGGVEVRLIVLDLATQGAAEELHRQTRAQGIIPRVVVNNAGIFSFCDVLATPAERIERIVMLHALTVAQTSRLYAADMAERGEGYLLNLSSFSQWMPFPGLGLYGASKAFVRTFSVAFAKEVREQGVRVTTVCPAGVATDLYGLNSRWQRIGRRMGVLITPDSCARRSLNALWRGRRSVVPDWWNRALIPLCKLLPMSLIRPLRHYTKQFQK